MKKILVILFFVFLFMPLFSRGVTENVVRDGIRGVSVYLENLERAENDKTLTSEDRKTVVEKVYMGMSYEDAVRSIRRSEEDSLPVNGTDETVEEHLIEEKGSSVFTLQYDVKEVPVPVETSNKIIGESGIDNKKDRTLSSSVETAILFAPAEESAVTDKSAAVSEEDNAEKKEGEEILFSGTFSYRGISTAITCSRTFSTLSIPSSLTPDQLDSFRMMILELYPAQASLVTYSVSEDGVIIIHYPEIDSSFLLPVLDVLKERAVQLIDDLFRVDESEVAEEKAPSEEISLNEEKAQSEDEQEHPEKKEDISLSYAEKEERGETVAPSPLENDGVQEKTEEKKKNIFSFNSDISLALGGKLRYYRGDDHLYPAVSMMMRGTVWNFLYVEAGADLFAYLKNKIIYLHASIDLNGGVDFSFYRFNIFAYGGLRYQFAPSSSSFRSGMALTYGAGLDWRITDTVILGGEYRFINAFHMFNAWLKFRF